MTLSISFGADRFYNSFEFKIENLGKDVMREKRVYRNNQPLYFELKILPTTRIEFLSSR